jgi:transposase
MIGADIQKLQKENEILREENRLLRQKVDLLIRQMFGKKSEKLSPGQLEMLLCGEQPPEEPEASVELPAPAEAVEIRCESKPRRPRYPENLPVEEQIIDPAEVTADPSQWRQIGAEVSEQLDYEPGRFIRRRTVRRTWVKRNDPDAVPVTAELPLKLLERGLLAPGLLAQIVVSKYADHLPLYRQEQIFKQRYGVHLGRNTLCRGVELVADSLQLIAKRMFEEQLRSGYVQLDETPVQYLCEDKGSAKGYFWVSHVPQGDTVYHWAPGRGYEHLKRWLPEDFNCIIQTDEYATYNKLTEDRGVKSHAHCWAHVRRRFVKAMETGEHPVRLRWILHQIGLLYKIEARLREQNAGPALRAAVRQSESRPILDRLFRLWDRMIKGGRIKPKSLTGTAMAYALRQREGLQVYFEYGQVEIDNNLVENAIRPAALGRKNWLFIGDKEAGWRSAVIYTILQSCKTHGIDPYAYLKDVLERLPQMTNQQIHLLTPRTWIEQRSMKLAS